MLRIAKNDTGLVEQLKLGDSAAYNQLYEQYWKKLYLHALSRTKEEESAKDVVQSVFIDIWERRATLHINTSLEQFLMGAVKLKVLNYFRSVKVTEKIMEETLRNFNQPATTINHLNDYILLERMIELELKELPENMRKAYLLKHDHFSTSEIAEKLNLAEQTVSNHISEAMRRIRKKLSDKFPEHQIS
jgi:RNA polymerase sigma-70 factor (family 1)